MPDEPPTIIAAGSGSTPAAPPAATANGSGGTPSAPPAATANGSGSTPAAPPVTVANGGLAAIVVAAAGIADVNGDYVLFGAINSRDAYSLNGLSSYPRITYTPELGGVWQITLDAGYPMYEANDEDGIPPLGVWVSTDGLFDPPPSLLRGGAEPGMPPAVTANGSSSTPAAPPVIV